ncbi:hypothetical protein [Sphingomonas sp. AX6]|uniref:hypothetical protein n=1 Tax=Sphingomonas sp. AX6 TaxID=2653171 RepID=UPI0012EFB98C|nr:hypothetical protein [Sphingomonas sp. AX6]VXC93461.1 conserved hypothetical protein [Sphingomonas sp. AX6]
MQFGLYAIVGLLAVAASNDCAIAQSADEATHRHIAAAGFIPLQEMTFGGRDVRRVLPIDPYGFLPIPGIELERHGGGRVTVRAQYRHWTGPAYRVSADEWNQIAALESAAFAPPGENRTKTRPGVVVHCWRGLLEASPSRAASWWGCNSGTKASQAYTKALLVLAMEKKGCPASDNDALRRFSECFRDDGTLDDPALQTQFAALRDRWTTQRVPGADILAQARQSLWTAKEDRVPTRLMAARRAVFAFGQHQNALRDMLRSSFTLFRNSVSMDTRSAAILSQTRSRWDEDIKAQNQNYVTLLEELAQLLAEDTRPPG